MALFNFGKKDGLKKVSVCSCQCGASGTEARGSTKADTGCCCDSSALQSVKVTMIIGNCLILPEKVTKCLSLLSVK